MKLMTFRRNDEIAAGYLDGDDVVICAEGSGAERAVLDLAAEGAAGVARWKAKTRAPRVPLSAVTVLAPMPAPRRDIFCVGKNYLAHAAEFHSSGFDSGAKEEVPSAPVIFTKATTS